MADQVVYGRSPAYHPGQACVPDLVYRPYRAYLLDPVYRQVQPVIGPVFVCYQDLPDLFLPR